MMRSRDLWTGLLYFAIGITALVVGRNYAAGSAADMGPGYFPKFIGWLLVLMALISVARSFSGGSNPVTPFALCALALIVGATALFAYLLPRMGFVAALAFLILVSASASRYFRFEPKAAIGFLMFIAFCTGLFVWGLGVPMPLLGFWFGG